METAIPFEAYLPKVQFVDPDTGAKWLVMDLMDRTYNEMPNALNFKGLKYAKMGWNSDLKTIHYREIIHIATPVRN